MTAPRVVVLPLAATEQHGPHLPETTDVDIGLGILAAALEALEPSARPEVLPMLEIGVSEEHESFPNTHSISAEEMVATIDQLVTDGTIVAPEAFASAVFAPVQAQSPNMSRPAPYAINGVDQAFFIALF